MVHGLIPLQAALIGCMLEVGIVCLDPRRGAPVMGERSGCVMRQEKCCRVVWTAYLTVVRLLLLLFIYYFSHSFGTARQLRMNILNSIDELTRGRCSRTHGMCITHVVPVAAP